MSNGCFERIAKKRRGGNSTNHPSWVVLIVLMSSLFFWGGFLSLSLFFPADHCTHGPRYRFFFDEPNPDVRGPRISVALLQPGAPGPV